MTCYLCNNRVMKVIFDYTKPDKYERWVGITEVSRQWAECVSCGFIQSFRNYPLERLEKIYKDGYRHPVFRGEAIGETYQKIVSLPKEHSENMRRCEWLWRYADPCKILDIGSGLGVFPVKIEANGFSVDCVEENKDSIEFIRDMGFNCYDKIPGKVYGMVTLIHVLEHIDDPVSFLQGIKKNIGKWLFVEVPSAIEFEYLDKNHDEFNSCHVKFYTQETLRTLLRKAGLSVSHITTTHYGTRNLSRILALCG